MSSPEPGGVTGDLVEEYRAYLGRFDDKVGPCEFGAYAKYNGRLIKKLRYEEFESRFRRHLAALERLVCSSRSSANVATSS